MANGISRYPETKPNIGYFRDRIQVKRIVLVDNGRGGWTQREDDVGSFWGQIIPMSAYNIIQYRQADMNVNTQFLMRFNSAIDTHCCFYANGMRYIVDSVQTDRQDRFMIILAIGEVVVSG